jgi:uncharacterized protein YuzE
LEGPKAHIWTMADRPYVTFDPKAKAAYIYYLTGSMKPGEAVKTITATPEINLDFDAQGCLIGVELLSPALLHPKLMPKR